jgi:small-conductance mechanosensitive channel
VRVGVAYGSDVPRVVELMTRAAEEHPSVLKEPAFAVLFEDFGDNALIFDLNVWINADLERDLRRVRSELRFRIEALFRESEVVIAFPQRDIHVDGNLTINRKPA